VLRNIVKINEEKCDGCGQCVDACAEGAIEIINGKATLVSEVYCDGLGACIGHCPQDAITVEHREADEFDEEATKAHLAKQKKPQQQCEFVCPGVSARNLRDELPPGASENISASSQLTHWPVQLKLFSPRATYFAKADLLLVADCVPFAMGDFHNRFLKKHSVTVGCPKLDDTGFYIEKLTQIIKINNLNSLTVIHMEVPCCSGLIRIAQKAIARCGANLPFEDVTIDLRGNVTKTETIKSFQEGQVHYGA